MLVRKRKSNNYITMFISVILLGSGLFFGNANASLSPNKQLLQAVISGSDHRVKQAIAQGANPDATDSNGYTALIRATGWDAANKIRAVRSFSSWPACSPAVVTALIQAGANTEAVDKNGYTALIRAARIENIEMIQTLLSRGARPPKGIKPPILPIRKRIIRNGYPCDIFRMPTPQKSPTIPGLYTESQRLISRHCHLYYEYLKAAEEFVDQDGKTPQVLKELILKDFAGHSEFEPQIN